MSKQELIIAGIADIHFGAHEPKLLWKQLEWLVNYLKELKPDIVVILGDLFDKKLMLNSENVIYANKFIQCLIDLKGTVVIEHGTLSHDFYQTDTYSHLLSNKFRMYKTVTYDNILGLKVLHIPEEYESDKNEYYKDYLNKDIDFVWGHGQFDFAGFWAKREVGKKNKIIFTVDDFKNVKGCVDFGHVHIHMEKGNCGYPGSFSRSSFGEEDPKGFYIRKYDLSKRKLIVKEFVKNPLAPVYKTIYYKDIDPKNDIGESIKKHLSKCYKLRLIIDSDIDEKIFNDIKAIEFSNPSLVIDKRIKGFSLEETLKETKEVEERRSKRQSILSKYEGMDLISLTQSIAKEKFDVNITSEDINRVFAGKYMD